MPPVGMIAVVWPALRASRTSIHVISSIHTVFGAGSGLTASAQLYGLSRQSPPPIDRGSGARCGACAATSAVRKASVATAVPTVFIMAISWS
jgi:hypothetical protein